MCDTEGNWLYGFYVARVAHDYLLFNVCISAVFFAVTCMRISCVGACVHISFEYTASCKRCVTWLCNTGLPAGRPHRSMEWSVIGECVV